MGEKWHGLYRGWARKGVEPISVLVQERNQQMKKENTKRRATGQQDPGGDALCSVKRLGSQ